MLIKIIKCVYCKNEFEYEDHGTNSVEEIPEGYFMYGEWYCLECVEEYDEGYNYER